MDRRQAPLSSEELIQRARDGDGEAFDELFRRYGDRLRSLIRLRLGRSLRRSVDLEDVLQLAQMHAHASIRSLEWKGEEELYRWLAGIVRPVIEGLVRPPTHERRAAVTRGDVSIGPGGEAGGNGDGSPAWAATADSGVAQRREALLARLEAALDRLDENEREVIVLARIEGLSMEEVATTLGRSTDAVSMLLVRALRELREDFQAEDSTYRDGPPPGGLESRSGAAGFLANRRDLRAEIETFDAIGAIVEQPPPEYTFGQFRIVREIGRGSTGWVYEAWQEPLARRVALKLISARCFPDQRDAVRFQRESSVLARLAHPGIVRVHEIGFEHGTFYVSMELVSGASLDQVLRRVHAQLRIERRSESRRPRASRVLELLAIASRFGSIPPSDGEAGDASDPLAGRLEEVEGVAHAYCRQLAEAFAEVADALQYAHAAGVLHRGLEPSHLMLDSNGRLRVLGFRPPLFHGESDATTALGGPGSLCYKSPEQLDRRAGMTGPSSDVYSLGAALYEMLAARAPFAADDERRLAEQIRKDDPPALRRLNPKVPGDLESIVLKCLRKDPRKRYATAEALAQELRRFVEGHPLEARPEPRAVHIARRVWRHRRSIASLIAAVIVVVVAIAVARNHREHARVERERELRRDLGAAAWDLREDALFAFRPSTTQLTRMTVATAPKYSPFAYPGEDAADGLRATREIAFDAAPSFGPTGADPVVRALRRLERTVTRFPREPVVHVHRAMALLRSDRAQEARSAVERALDLDAENVQALVLRSYLLDRDGDAIGAAVDMRRARARAGPQNAAWLTGMRAELDHDWREAAAAYEALGSGPELFERAGGPGLEARLGRGVARLKADDLGGALEDFFAGRAREPGRLEPLLLLGKVDCLEGDLARAESRFRDAFAMSDEDEKAKVAMWISAAYREGGEFELAAKWLDELRARPGTIAVRLSLLARLHADRGQHDEAIAAARDAVAASPEDVATHLVLGDAYLGRGGEGDLERAEDTFLRAGELAAPGDGRPLAALGVTLAARGELVAAEERLRAALARAPQLARAHHALGTVLRRAGDLAAARRSCEEAIRLAPGDGLARNSLGVICEKEGNLDAAIEQYEAAITRTPGIDVAHYNLAWAYHRRRQLARAVEEYGKARRLGFDPPLLRHHLAVCLTSLGEFRRAIELLDGVLRDEPTRFGALYDRGVANELRGDLAAALRDFRECVAREPDQVEAREALAAVLESSGRHADAAREYRTIVELDPGNAAAFDHLAASCLRDGRAPLTAEELRAEIRAFERLIHLPGAGASLAALLEDDRTKLLPDLASYASVDWLVSRSPALHSEDEDARRQRAGQLAAYRATPDVHPGRIDYLDGRILQLAGRPEDAALRFASAARFDPSRPEPLIRWAECLGAVGDLAGAEDILRRALATDPANEARSWDAWLGHVLSSLSWSAGETIERIALLGAAGDGSAEDAVWALERIAAGETIRINCGGGEFRDAAGDLWSRDRLWRKGQSSYLNVLHTGGASRERLDETDYTIRRTLAEPEELPLYAIPLPRGRYRVALRFVDDRIPGATAHPGLRFDVLLEGAAQIEDHAPFGMDLDHAGVRAEIDCVVLVEDGWLEIDLRPGDAGGAGVAAIEVERLPRDAPPQRAPPR